MDYLPSLATDWTISEDGKVYTFTIREGVHFQKGKYQDGRELTPEDVAWSLNRAHEESWWGYLPFFDHAEVQDGKVVCYLENANATFLHELTSTSGIIVPKEEVEGWGEEFGSHPISTGPFIISEHVPDQYTKLVKNPDYWGVEPYLDAITYYIITDEAQAMNALTTGEVDIVLTVSGNYIQQVKDTAGPVPGAREPPVLSGLQPERSRSLRQEGPRRHLHGHRPQADRRRRVRQRRRRRLLSARAHHLLGL